MAHVCPYCKGAHRLSGCRHWRLGALILVALLAACGGGDDDPDRTIGPPDCRQEACR